VLKEDVGSGNRQSRRAMSVKCQVSMDVVDVSGGEHASLVVTGYLRHCTARQNSGW